MSGQGQVVKLDVREDLRNGCEPFARIMQAVARLRGRQKLLLIAPFEPVPLMHLLRQQGFRYRSEPGAGGDWEVLFEREPDTGNR